MWVEWVWVALRRLLRLETSRCKSSRDDMRFELLPSDESLTTLEGLGVLRLHPLASSTTSSTSTT